MSVDSQFRATEVAKLCSCVVFRCLRRLPASVQSVMFSMEGRYFQGSTFVPERKTVEYELTKNRRNCGGADAAHQQRFPPMLRHRPRRGESLEYIMFCASAGATPCISSCIVIIYVFSSRASYTFGLSIVQITENLYNQK